MICFLTHSMGDIIAVGVVVLWFHVLRVLSISFFSLLRSTAAAHVARAMGKGVEGGEDLSPATYTSAGETCRSTNMLSADKLVRCLGGGA